MFNITAKTGRLVLCAFRDSILVGALLVGIPLGIYGAWGALDEPVVRDGKRKGEEQSVIGHGSLMFCMGAFIGGVIGTVGGVAVAERRLRTRSGEKPEGPAVE
jgi:hypothetical protein